MPLYLTYLEVKFEEWDQFLYFKCLRRLRAYLGGPPIPEPASLIFIAPETFVCLTLPTSSQNDFVWFYSSLKLSEAHGRKMFV